MSLSRLELMVRSPGTGPTTPPAAPVASRAAAPALWPAVVFGFAGLYLQARTKGLGRFAPRSRYWAAATFSTLTWCAVLGGSCYVATSAVLRRTSGRSGHGAALSHAVGERVALLLLAAVIVGLAALVELPAQPSRRGAYPPRT